MIDFALPFVLAALAPSVPPPAPLALAQDSKPADEELQQAAREIQAHIEQLRGSKFPQPVVVKQSDKASLVAYLERRIDMETTPERQKLGEEVAKLLGLIPPDMDLMAATKSFLESQVGGFYDPPTKTFYVMDSFGGELARVIMSHEFVHALDDQLWDLDGTLKRLGPDTDRIAAFGALCEGSGTLTMTQWMFAHAREIDPATLAEVQQMTSQGMENLPPFIWKGALASYLCGQSFLEKAVAKKSKKKSKDAPAEQSAAAAPPTYGEQLERAFRDPPRSTEQILHPQKYWGAERDEPVAVSFDTSNAPSGWKIAGEDTLGELALAMLTEPRSERKGIRADDMFAVLAMKWTNDGAEGWDGDRLVVLARGAERILQLVTAWDTEKDAREFADVLSDRGDAARIPLRAGSEATSAGSLAPNSIDVEVRTAEPGAVPCVVVRVRALAKADDAAARAIALPWKLAQAAATPDARR
jgi:hypothetical protein